MSDRLALAVAELIEALRESVRAGAEAGPRTPDRLLSIDEASAMLGQGRSRIYQEIAAGRLNSCKAGRRRLIPSDAIRAYIERAVAS